MRRTAPAFLRAVLDACEFAGLTAVPSRRGFRSACEHVKTARHFSTAGRPGPLAAAQRLGLPTAPSLGRSFAHNVHDLDSDADLSAMQELPSYADASLQRSLIVIDGMAPDFSGDAVIDNEITKLDASTYRGRWVVLFFYPKDFTFVCPTEIIAFNDRAPEFERRNAAVVGVSCDSAEVHMAWMQTPRKRGGLGHMEIPLIADVDRRVAAAYGALNASNVTNRAIYIIDPEGKLKSMQVNQNDVGRSVDEALRLVDAYAFVAEHGVVCPADWQPGKATMVADAEKSQEYFAQAGAEGLDDDDDFARTLQPITSKAQYKELVATGYPMVVDFMAGWCGKCRMIAPTVEALQRKYPNITFVKFDTSREDGGLHELAAELGVKTLPAFRFFLGGSEVGTEVLGYKKRPLEQEVARLAERANSR